MWLGGSTGICLLVLPVMRLGEMQLSGSPFPVLDQRIRGTVYYGQPASTILNPPTSTGMGFWSLNTYVGCEFGCTYCYARYAHRYAIERARDGGRLDGAAIAPFRGSEWLAFEQRILVKRKGDVLAALDRDLAAFRRRNARGTESIAIGTATDPYQPAERRFGITRAALERLVRERGFSIGITTKSPLVCRDIELLLALQQRHDVHVQISLIGTDADLIRRFEARSPMPHTRLRALRRLAQSGVNAGLIAAPVLPGISDSESQLDDLLRAAMAAGARFALYSPLRLYAGVRPVFLPLVDRHYPHLAARYRAAYQAAGHVRRDYRAALSRRFRRLAARHHLPVGDPLRARSIPLRAAAPVQLSLLPHRESVKCPPSSD